MAATLIGAPGTPLKRFADTFPSSTESAKRVKTASAAANHRPNTRRHYANPCILATANALPSEKFCAQHVPPDALSYTAKDGTGYAITLHKSSELTPASFDQCFRLIECTSSDDYRASGHGWHPAAKRAEMADKDMWYLVVRRMDRKPVMSIPDRGSDTVPTEEQAMTGESTADKDTVVGFTSFMLTIEDQQPVIYVYEVHFVASARGSGLGTHLMRLQERIGRNVGVWKSMLTVFTRNARAEGFYRTLGYHEDDISPVDKQLRGGRVRKPDYYILSRAL